MCVSVSVHLVSIEGGSHVTLTGHLYTPLYRVTQLKHVCVCVYASRLTLVA
jgi:hypothetical protein